MPVLALTGSALLRGADVENPLPGRRTMSSRKKTHPTPRPGLQKLKPGSRVRCTDDRVHGRSGSEPCRVGG